MQAAVPRAGPIRISESNERTLKVLRHGTHRSQSLSHTFSRVWRLAPIMGITRVANVTGLDWIGIPVAMVCRPNSRSVAVSQGKGVDYLSAQVSGLMEASELYHAETITLPLRLCSYEELRYQHNVVGVDQLPRIERSPFHPNLRVLWCEGRDLFTGQKLFVPYEMVHTNYTLPFIDRHRCFPASSNGLASGNCAIEAISHALCEIVERDATTLWMLHGEKKFEINRVDPATIDDPVCQDLFNKIADAGISIGIWDITTDVGIAAFACFLIPQENGDMWQCPVSEGYGCHPDRQIALIRALTEAAQARLTIIAGSRDDFWRRSYKEFLDPDKAKTLRQHLEAVAPTRRFADVPNLTDESFEADVEAELASLSKVGVRQVVVVNLTKPAFELPVVRVIVPGLEGGFDPGYVPGRRAQDRFGVKK
jgi:YcaO-like protein with predicted kinase domain